MTVANIIELLGGLAFFLFGMTLLGDALKRVAGSKLETVLAKLTSTTFKGVLLGAFVTAVIQSSSATTIMVVGFVNSGIMRLANAIGIIMGANIGTTATGWLLVLAGVEGKGSFSSATIFALVAFIGIILYFFCRKPGPKNLGMILMAFSVLMSGMQSMSGAMTPLKESPAFLNFISAVSNPLVAMLIGIVVTAIIQSNSAAVGILQALAVTGVIGYDVAIPMVVGTCIGACMPVLLSAIGANLNGKRAALIYLYFNLAGAVILMGGFYLLDAFADFAILHQTADSMGIAIFNTVFKVAATIILMPMSGLLEKWAVITVPEKKIETEKQDESLLEERFLQYPPLALEHCAITMDQMLQTAAKNFEQSATLLRSYDESVYNSIMERENTVDAFEDSLGSYLIRLNTMPLSEKETRSAANFLSCLTNVERISDHAVNLAELAKELYEKKVRFSENATNDLTLCIQATNEILALTIRATRENDPETIKMVEPLEDVIDLLVKRAKKNHIQRVQSGACTLELGFVLNECLSDIERVADHCSNIAVGVLETLDANVQAHSYLHTIKSGTNDEYHHLLVDYAGKYDIALQAKED